MTEQKLFKQVKSVGDIMIKAFHIIGLFVIGATVIWSGVHVYFGMLGQGLRQSQRYPVTVYLS
jgi:hypothetical protein